jgi:uncharacterized RDD family membrane protein YckC
MTTGAGAPLGGAARALPRSPRGYPGPSWDGDGALAAARPRVERVARDTNVDGGPPADQLAGFGRRFVGFLIDFLIVFLIGSVLVIAFVGSPTGTGGDASGALPRLIVSFVNIGGLRLLYNWYFNTRGWSPGKRATGLRIVRVDGSVPGPRYGLFRAAGAVVSGELTLWLGYLWAVFDSRNQTWHDKLAGTYVVIESESESESESEPED